MTNLFLGIIAICMMIWTMYMAWFAWISKDWFKMYKRMMEDFEKPIEVDLKEMGE